MRRRSRRRAECSLHGHGSLSSATVARIVLSRRSHALTSQPRQRSALAQSPTKIRPVRPPDQSTARRPLSSRQGILTADRGQLLRRCLWSLPFAFLPQAPPAVMSTTEVPCLHVRKPRCQHQLRHRRAGATQLRRNQSTGVHVCAVQLRGWHNDRFRTNRRRGGGGGVAGDDERHRGRASVFRLMLTCAAVRVAVRAAA